MLWPQPGPHPVDLDAVYGDADRPTPPRRPWVMVNMIASVDGATAVDGVSGGLGGPGDRAVFSALRSRADAIVAAAGTVRDENYGPPRVDPDQAHRRRARGQGAQAELVVITGSANLDPAARLFADGHRPLVLTAASADATRRAALANVAEVLEVGAGPVDLEAALATLADRGHRVVLVEGGPSLNGQLAAADLIDEVCLTISPLLVGGDSSRIAVGPGPGVLRPLELAHLLEADGLLFARYVRSDR